MSKQKEFDVSVIGGVGFDSNSYLYGNEIDFDIEANFTINKDCIGGSGGYSSISFSKLDLQTAFIGAIGEDMFGKQILAEFNDHEIDGV